MTAEHVIQKARFRLALWTSARTMPLRVKGRDLANLLATYEPPTSQPYVGITATEILAAIRKVTHHPWAMRDRRCLRQSLLAYRYLRLAGFQPAIHFGIDRSSLNAPRISAHCWVVLDNRVVLNPPAESMTTVFVHTGPAGQHGAPAPLPQVADRTAA